MVIEIGNVGLGVDKSIHQDIIEALKERAEKLKADAKVVESEGHILKDKRWHQSAANNFSSRAGLLTALAERIEEAL